MESEAAYTLSYAPLFARSSISRLARLFAPVVMDLIHALLTDAEAERKDRRGGAPFVDGVFFLAPLQSLRIDRLRAALVFSLRRELPAWALREALSSIIQLAAIFAIRGVTGDAELLLLYAAALGYSGGIAGGSVAVRLVPLHAMGPFGKRRRVRAVSQHENIIVARKRLIGACASYVLVQLCQWATESLAEALLRRLRPKILGVSGRQTQQTQHELRETVPEIGGSPVGSYVKPNIPPLKLPVKPYRPCGSDSSIDCASFVHVDDDTLPHPKGSVRVPTQEHPIEADAPRSDERAVADESRRAATPTPQSIKSSIVMDHAADSEPTTGSDQNSAEEGQCEDWSELLHGFASVCFSAIVRVQLFVSLHALRGSVGVTGNPVVVGADWAVAALEGVFYALGRFALSRP